MIAGQRDPAVLADLAKRRLRSKIPALTGRFSEHHAFRYRDGGNYRIPMSGCVLAQIDAYYRRLHVSPFRGRAPEPPGLV